MSAHTYIDWKESQVEYWVCSFILMQN